jgi:hypothetical protein
VLQSKTFKRQFLTANYCQGAMVSWILSETHHDRQCIGFTLQLCGIQATIPSNLRFRFPFPEQPEL